MSHERPSIPQSVPHYAQAAFFDLASGLRARATEVRREVEGQKLLLLPFGREGDILQLCPVLTPTPLTILSL
jgi:hypothetical protein